VIFLRFQILKSIARPKAMCFSFRVGGFTPLIPQPRALPLDLATSFRCTHQLN